jgi:hypothetical protein
MIFLRRQLKEAYEAETDPELKEALRLEWIILG